MYLHVNFGGNNHLYKDDLNRFSDSSYKCIRLYLTDKHELIGVCKSKKRLVMPYRISFGNSELFFKSISEVDDFIKERYKDFKEVVRND